MRTEDDGAADGWLWWLDRCPAPTTSPAWRPARYLVFRGAFAPLSTNTRASLKFFGFVGQVGQSWLQM